MTHYEVPARWADVFAGFRADLATILADNAPPVPFQRRTPRLCTIDGCGRKHLAKGLCRTHYYRARVR